MAFILDEFPCDGCSSSQLTYPCCQGTGGFFIPLLHVFSVVTQEKTLVISWRVLSLPLSGVLAPSSRDSGLYWWDMGLCNFLEPFKSVQSLGQSLHRALLPLHSS